ncbi:MAG: translation initiation factor IF-2 [Bacteroidales bacterium]|nr:translation initiation factor IF-2 [Bacteroidales bacterium]MDD4685490.1 translation initiation factor IF-2 [Bacteroidales bacterium]
MSGENKTIRLNKVAKEFNVGISTLVDFLAKKGKSIENNPNTKIDKELYDILSSAFISERKVKEEASKLDFSTQKTIQKTIEAEEQYLEPTSKAESEDTGVEEIMIKTKTLEYTEPSPQKAEKTEKEDKEEEVKKEKKKAEKTQKVEQEEKKEEKVEAKIEEVKEADKEDKTEKVKPAKAELKEEGAIKEAEAPVEEKTETPAEPKPAQVKKASDDLHSLNIVGKIDLDSINSKTKPDKKSKSELAHDREEKRKLEQDKKDKQQKDNKTKRKPATKEATTSKETPKHSPEKKHEAKDKPVVVKDAPKSVEEESTEANFIETQYVKLTGPVVSGEKIDLSQFDKPKKQVIPASQQTDADGIKRDKKKRRRIKQAPTSNIAKPTLVGDANHPGQAIEPSKSKSKAGAKSKFPKPKKELKKVEISNEEIEKQIKDTLARLSSTGKSRASKHRRDKRQSVQEHHQIQFQQEQEELKILKVTEFVTANELATMMDIPVTKIISSCMSLGMFVSINQRLDAEAIQLISEEFGFSTEFVSADVVEALEGIEEVGNDEDLVPRAPIVTVMGHVDHGKTSLLDYIRKSNVIQGEAGGITQHIGAYEVVLKSGKKMTFLDTPGHEAFTAMRARGAKITDVAIIVIASDDRVMPQTVEAINHAQAAGVPIVFAINKIDTVGADPEKIKTELAAMNILVEDWGGKFQSQEISAKKGTNIYELLEKVLLEAELLELKGNPKIRAKGTVIESSLDKGKGYVAKLLVQDGHLKTGDFVLAGTTYGRVKAMYNERNSEIDIAGPSAPVLLLGLNGAPQAGDTFNVMSTEKEAKDLANRRTQLQREQGLRTQKHITLDEIGRRIAIGDFKQLDLIVKGDVDGSVEALSDSLLQLSTPEIQVNIIHKSVGQITETDVLLATASNAIIIGFQVRPSLGARKLAESEQIDIRLYSIIYTAINELKDAIEGMLSPEIEEKIVANLEIREVFKITKVGTIAGCMCLDGKISRHTNVRVIRDGIVVYTGKLASLKRFKDEVKEVVVGQECGLNIENFNDIKVGDIIEGYEEFEVKRKL